MRPPTPGAGDDSNPARGIALKLASILLCTVMAALLRVLAGLLGGTAQILMTESYRQADASTLAPMDYTSMVYGLAIGYVVFAEVPGWSVLIGASIVIAAGVLIIWRERRLGLDNARARAARTPQG